jgi:hypothetical protein
MGVVRGAREKLKSAIRQIKQPLTQWRTPALAGGAREDAKI